MKNNYIGQDGFVWWIGIVESRQDPLKLGRCKVRIFGWHDENVETQPTVDLPWTYPVIPLDHGKNTIGPKEGDWVFGFFGDAQKGQKPFMQGILPNMREQSAPSPEDKVGFQDLRPDDILEGHNQPYTAKFGDQQQRVDGYGTNPAEYETVSRYPDIKELKEPLTSRFARGFSYGVILKTTAFSEEKQKEKDEKDKVPLDPNDPLNSLIDPETGEPKDGLKLPGDVMTEIGKKEDDPALELGSLIFQNLSGDITTSEGRDAILRAGGYEAAGTVLWEENGQIFLVDIFGEFKEGTVYGEDGSTYEVIEVRPQPMGHLYRTILRPKILNAIDQKYIPIAESKEAVGEFAVFKVNVGGSFSEPIPPYNAAYPYNHVYESESGHLLEFDDTPGFERIQLLHRSGTFEEVHPNGLKVEKVTNDHYIYSLKNKFIHTEGKEYHTIDKAYKLLVNTDADIQGHYTVLVGPNGDVNICTASGKINFYATKDFNIFSEGNINMDAENIQLHSRKDTIIHTEGNVDWAVDKNKKLTVANDFAQTVGGGKKTSVANDYKKTVGDNYESSVGGSIFEGSNGSNTTRSAFGITEMSFSNTRISVLSITDITASMTKLVALSNIGISGGDDIDLTFGSDLTFSAGTILEMSDTLIKQLSPNNYQVSLLDIDCATVGVYPFLSLTIEGFTTSNGIVHGTTFV